jgi:hypothetical protein
LSRTRAEMSDECLSGRMLVGRDSLTRRQHGDHPRYRPVDVYGADGNRR